MDSYDGFEEWKMLFIFAAMMEIFNNNESGIVSEGDFVQGFTVEMTDVTVVGRRGVNVLARGCRYGRLWMLKGLREELRTSTVHRQQLMKEFEIHIGLRYHGIVQVTGIEEVAGLGLCMVMEWIEGETLAAALRGGRLSKADRRRIMREIAESVDYMHNKGVVHRDLKPENVMLRRAGGEAVIIDLGLADADVYTLFKQSAGTEGYISPEQVERGGTDTGDDVYSLGVIMDELCPEYKRIARRCTGSGENRPENARKVLEMMTRRDGLSRRVGLALAGLALACAGLLVWMKMGSLSYEARANEQMVTELKVAVKERDMHVNELNDSLEAVGRRVLASEEAQRRVQARNEARERALAEGRRRVISIIEKFEREFVPKDKPYDLSASGPEHQTKLSMPLRDIADNYGKTINDTLLTESDKESIRAEISSFVQVNYDKYHKKWLRK